MQTHFFLHLSEIGSEQSRIGFVRFSGLAAAADPFALSFMQTVGMVLEFHQAAAAHFLNPRPRQMRIGRALLPRLAVCVRPAADGRNDDLHIVFLREWISVNVIVIVAIVKGEQNRLFRQLRLPVHIGQQVGNVDRRIALFL